MTSKQRAYLISLGMKLKPCVMIGKDGLTPEVTRNAEEALTANELIKLGVLKNCEEDPGSIADMIAEDDADHMIRILEDQFSIIAPEYFLNEDEVEKAVENLQALISAEMLKQMYQYGKYEVFARQLIEMAIDPVVSEREYIELPDEEEYSDYLTDVLESIYEDVNDEVVPDENDESEE